MAQILAIGCARATIEAAIFGALARQRTYQGVRAFAIAEVEALGREHAVAAWLVEGEHPELTPAALRALQGRGLPVLRLLRTPGEVAASRRLGLPAVAWGAPPEEILLAVAQVIAGEAGYLPDLATTAGDESGAPVPSPWGIAPDPDVPDVAADAGPLGEVIAVTSGAGSPGRTQIACNLAAACASRGSTVLIDGDLDGPGIAPALGLGVDRNLALLLAAQPQTPAQWAAALRTELVPLTASRFPAAVLAGVANPARRTLIAPAGFQELLRALRRHYRYVVVDCGGGLGGGEQALVAPTCRVAERVVIVLRGDTTGVWRARLAREGLLVYRRAAPDLVLNQYEPRADDPPAAIAAALGQPLAATIPRDPATFAWATRWQRLALDGRGRGGLRRAPAPRAILRLAADLTDGPAIAPREADTTAGQGARRRPWPRLAWEWRRERRGGGDPTGEAGTMGAVGATAAPPDNATDEWRAASRAPDRSGSAGTDPRVGVVPATPPDAPPWAAADARPGAYGFATSMPAPPRGVRARADAPPGVPGGAGEEGGR